jgi:hypothetical protein
MNVVEEPDLFVCTLFDFMKILYLETPTASGILTLLESVVDPLGSLTPDENSRHLEINTDHEEVVTECLHHQETAEGASNR